jgi:dihydroflavonol-4-reductase
MRTLVLGSNGFIGANIVREALDEGWAVRAFHRTDSNLSALAGLGVEHCTGDLKDVESLKRAMAGVDVVFHPAAPYPLLHFDGKRQVREAVQTVRNVLEAAQASGSPRLVYTSSLTTIGRPSQPGAIANEDCAPNLRSQHTPYHEMKECMEREVLDAAAKGYPAVVVNPTMCLGPYDSKPTSGRLVLAIARGEMPAYIEAPVNVVDIRDVARGHLLAAQKGQPGSRYILGNANMMMSDLVRDAATSARVPIPRLRVPPVFALAVAYAGEYRMRLLGGKPPHVPIVGVELLRYSQHFDSRRAMEELGYAPRELRAVYEDTLTWFEHVGLWQKFPRKD